MKVDRQIKGYSQNFLTNKALLSDDDRVVSQGLMFFVAGAETIAGTTAFTLYEFALNPSTQEKARKEVNDVINTKGLTYETLAEMKYLDKCIYGEY